MAWETLKEKHTNRIPGSQHAGSSLKSWNWIRGQADRSRVETLRVNQTHGCVAAEETVYAPGYGRAGSARNGGGELLRETEENAGCSGRNGDGNGGRWRRRGRYRACASPSAAQCARTHREKSSLKQYPRNAFGKEMHGGRRCRRVTREGEAKEGARGAADKCSGALRSNGKQRVRRGLTKGSRCERCVPFRNRRYFVCSETKRSAEECSRMGLRAAVKPHRASLTPGAARRIIRA